MDGKRITEKIKEKFETELKQSGYQINVSSDWFRTGIVVSKKSKKVYHNFRFLIEQNTNKNPIVYGFWLHISFPELEQILSGILKNHHLIGSSSKPEEVLDSFQIENNLKNSLPEEGIEIKSDKDNNHLMDLFYKFYKEDALPFFDKWNSLFDLYSYIKGLPEDRKILSEVLGQFYQFKKAIIYRLCNDHSALEYINTYYKRRKDILENYPEEIVAERYYNASKELKEVLEATQPIYNKDI